MKQILKKTIISEKKGITLISLIVTIVLLLILSSITVSQGLDAYRNSKLKKFVAEMQTIQIKVDLIVANKEDYTILGEAITTRENAIPILITAFNNNELKREYSQEESENYRYFTKENIAEHFEVDNPTSDVIINFATREVVAVDGIEYEGDLYYTQYNLPGGQHILTSAETVDRSINDISIETIIDGLNATIKIGNVNITNGKIIYKCNDDSWSTLINHTEKNKEYEVILSTTGVYTFKLIDNTNADNFTEAELNLVLTNAPKLEEGMTQSSQTYNYANYQIDESEFAKATMSSTEYIWVPRYAVNGETIKFLRGNSRIATDNTYLDDTWVVPDKFNQDNKELTGIWVDSTLIDTETRLITSL